MDDDEALKSVAGWLGITLDPRVLRRAWPLALELRRDAAELAKRFEQPPRGAASRSPSGDDEANADPWTR
ncbi:MAG TPA: hypothetical protein VFW86_05200 [Candidatus Limnocylindrales bacterium]|jgi:hypothetical protein|nr:hypothetical protein [Candidatus Limnocylindrales bacterium]